MILLNISCGTFTRIKLTDVILSTAHAPFTHLDILTIGDVLFSFNKEHIQIDVAEKIIEEKTAEESKMILSS